MSEIAKFIEKFIKIPREISEEECLIIPSDQLDKVLTPKRKEIIKLLYDQNPITEEKLLSLFRYNTHKDLVVLNYLTLIIRQKVDDSPEHDIITLNRKIKVI